MMYWVTLNLGKGSLAQGFSSVTVQIWQPKQLTPIQRIGALPPAPDLEASHHRWRQFYLTLYTGMGWRKSLLKHEVRTPIRNDWSDDFEIIEEDITVISRSEFLTLCEKLKEQFNQWLHNDLFRLVDQLLRTQLHPDDHIRLIVTAETDEALGLPWHLWEFLDDYPLAELALSPANYGRSPSTSTASLPAKVRILAILGDRQGIDTDADQQFLQQLPHSEITFLVEPDQATVSEQLWKGHWDILFFAGHSSSQDQGYIRINPNARLSIEQIKYGLQTAIRHGLKLAIFNSCDGLSLAHDLAELHLPHIIVMRESVPDRIAQEFLKSFLAAFSGGRSLHASVRQARERLQSWADEFPCATWLPVICQNPAEESPFWQDWYRDRQFSPRLPQPRERAAIGFSSLLAVGAIAAIRWLGLLQPLELAAFDQFLQRRPAELPDSRLLIVNVTEDDIRAEGQAIRQGSLSDRTLSRLLQRIEQAQPQVIGLDIYHDFAAGPELASQLKSQRLVAICKRPDTQDDPSGVLPPPEVEPAQLGFSDVVQDDDGVIRRHLLFTSPNSASVCVTPYALSVQLAFRYLHAQGISPQFTPDSALQLGDVTFHALRSRSGGYQSLDARGSQILLNYRAAPTLSEVAQQVTVGQILKGEVPVDTIKDRIVLIGVATSSTGDRWMTPYGRAFGARPPGVVLQAQMTSQLLSAVLNGRPLLQVWHPLVELIWISAWAGLGGVLAWGMSRWQRRAIACAIVINLTICYLLLLQGLWIPCIPAIATLLLSFLLYRLNLSRFHSSSNL
ncbi:CHASE2 domain-containing protein [Leptolyngbya sp. FACHB-16]|nr:CHASE2 domain-containing protein [Leptolyngbya sp. FACHB-8]MBD2158196.1 CHASE2 domain-containing protein [Leptolyngbya sp. FACHB-16]